MTLDQLPTELLHRICSDCCTIDAANFRLVCRLFSVVGAEYLLPDLELYMTKDRFSAVQRVLTNPRVAKGVRSLCLQADQLPYYDSFKHRNESRMHGLGTRSRESYLAGHVGSAESYDLMQSERGERLLNRKLAKAWALGEGSPTARKLVQAFKQYKKLLASQEELWDHGAIWHRLREILEACPRLECVILTMRGRLSPFYELPHFQKAMVYPGSGYNAMPADVDCLDEDLVENVLFAAVEARKQLRRLEIAPMPHYFFRLEAPVLAHITEAIGRLETLHISIHDTYLFPNEDNIDDEEFSSMSFPLMAQHLGGRLWHASTLCLSFRNAVLNAH